MRAAAASRTCTAAAAVLALALAGCGSSSSTAPGTVQSTSTPTTSAPAPGSSLASAGRTLYEQDGCSGCHSLNGTRLTGPTWQGLAGSTVHLSDGRSVIATNAYLTRHIIEPSVYKVAGYPAEVMEEAIAELHLGGKPKDVRELVAFIDSLRG